MAGDFLKRKAEEQAKIIDEKYGEGKYGSTSYLKSKIEEAKKTSTSEKSSSTKSGGAKADKSNGKTGDWLKNKVVESSLEATRKPYKAPNTSNNATESSTRPQNSPTTQTEEQGGKKDSWFKAGAFADGSDGFFDFLGDAAKTVGGTVGDLGIGLLKGVGRLAEGIVDLGTYGVAGVGALFGADEFAENTKNVARYSATDEWTKGATDFVDKYSVIGNKGDAIAEGLGQVAGIIGTAGIGGALGLGGTGATALTTGITGLSSMGTNMGEAYEGGATDGEAVLYGFGTGATEAATELLSGGLGKGVKALGISRGIGGLDDIFAKKLAGKVTKAITNESVQKVVGNTLEYAAKAGGEGAEEVLSGLGSAVMKKLTYMSKEDIGKLIEDENLLEQFVVGSIVSSIAQTPSYINANKTGTDFVTGQTLKQERATDALAEMVIAQKEASGAKLTTVEKNKIYNDVTSTVASALETAPDTLEKAAWDVVAQRDKVDGLTLLENRRRGIVNSTTLDVLTENDVEITADEVRKVTGFGEEGSKLVTRLANQEGKTFSQAVRAVKNAYDAGFTDLKASKVSFVNAVQKAAFDAGKFDRGVQDREAVARSIHATARSGVFTENEYTKDFTESDRKMISTFAGSLKMDVSVVDNIIASVVNGNPVEANAQHQDGDMRISSTAEKILYEMVIHEGGHRMRQLAPTEFGVLMNALYERAARRSAKLGVPHSTSLDSVKAEHDNAGIIMDTSGYLEEFAVRELETIFSSAEEFNNWYAELSGNQQVKTAWERFVDWIHKVAEDIKTALAQTKMTKEERTEAKRALAELDRIKELYANAFKAAENAAAERAEAQAKQSAETQKSTDSEGVVNYSLSPTKRKRLEETILNISNANIKKTAGSKEITILTDQFSVNKAIYSKKGRTDREVNARIKAIPEFESLIRQSTFSHTDTDIVGLDNAAKKNVVAMHYFETVYNGFDVEIVVRDKGKKQFLYEVKFIENKKSSQQSMPTDVDSTAPKGDVENKIRISQTSNFVKDFSLKKENPSNVLEKKVETEYNKNTSYSLKNWRTDLNATQFKQVETWLRQIDNHEPKRIADTDACWYKGRIDGEALFAIYSTATASNPTILYERKGAGANIEQNILLTLLEEKENGESDDRKSAYVNWVSGSGWMQNVNGSQNNLGNLGGGRHNQNAGVLPGQSKRNGSRAFWNVVENLFRKQEQDGRLNKTASHSLKGGVSATELLDTIEDVQKGKADAKRRLAKYAEDGIVSTERYNRLVEKYGAIPKGEKPHRDVQVPKKTADNKKVSQTVRTILEAKATPDEALPTIEKMVEDGVFSYDVYTDKQAIKDAEEHLKGNGWTHSFAEWMRDVERGIVSKQHTAMGWALYNNAVNTAAETTSETERREAMETALSVLDGMVRHQRSAAQALQATRILKSLSPETQLYGVQKSVQAFQKELIDKYKDKAPNLKINERLAERFLKAKTEDERLEIEKEIYKDIGRQMPSRFIDKWNAWRYLAMLGNVRTHVRNIVGNAGFAPVVLAKNLTATAIESAVNRVSHKKIVRSKALITGSKADRALLNAAWSDYNNVADIISNGGKYSDSAMANQHIEEGRKIFKTKPLEWARKKNSALLEKEDMWFSKPHYAYALAQYCKANNITAEQIARGKAIAPAREYAIKEAQKATYRDTNAFSQFVSSLGRGGEIEHVPKVVSMAVEGVLPYRKTPANILVRGVEYSPIGLLKGLTYDLKQVQKGKMQAYEAIDNISAGLTGTGLLALGVLLAAQGLVRGHGEEEKEEKEFKELMGHQSYALELPNGSSVTLDWLAPEALPFFVGVNLWEATKGSKEKVSLSTILQSVTNISEPMLEMSCLQSLNDLGEGIGYASSNDTSFLVSAVSSAVTSYLTQGIPTLFGQAERTGEENRMTTYTEKNGFLTGDMQYTLGKASAKIPLWEYNQIPYIDAWGRKEASGTALKRGFNNFLNPAYTSTVEESKMEKELLRLFDKTGEASVFPKRADKSFKVDGKDKHLAADEYVRYATLKGEKSYKAVTSLVNSSAYKKLTDAEKVKAIADAYDYANQKAKKAISSSYKTDAWISAADEFGTNIGNYLSFKTELGSTKKEKGDSFSKQDVVDIILDTAQNDKEIWLMYLSEYDAKKDVEAHNIGIEGGEYMNVLQNLDKYDEPNKNGKLGTYTNDEIANAISMEDGLTNRERAELWQTMTGSTSTKNNPFR